MRARTLVRAFLIAFGAIALGLAGASAFHPDDPSLVASLPLWRIFGLLAYAGIAAIPVLTVAALVSAVLYACGRWHARGLRA